MAKGNRPDSGWGKGDNTGDEGSRVRAFYDKTEKFANMSMHEFENAIRDKSVEYVGLFDANGKLVVAGTSNHKEAVAIPTGHPDFKKAVILTHNHPNGDNRVIGGSFSSKDIKNHIRLGFAGESRAVANGPNENTYIFRAKRGAKRNSYKMMAAADKVEKEYESRAQKSVNSVRRKLAAKGKTLNGKDNQAYIGTAKRMWKDSGMEKFGYEYVEVKKKRW